MSEIGGNTKAVIQVRTSVKNAIGASETTWKDAETLEGAGLIYQAVRADTTVTILRYSSQRIFFWQIIGGLTKKSRQKTAEL